MAVELNEEQDALIKEMGNETIKAFGTVMLAFEIPNYIEVNAIDGLYEYKLRIEKSLIAETHKE